MASSSKNPDRPVNFKLVEDPILSLCERLQQIAASKNHSETQSQREKLYRELHYIMDVFSKLGDFIFGSEVSTSLKELHKEVKHLQESVNDVSSPSEQVQSQIHKLGNSITKLKVRLPSLHYRPSAFAYTDGKRVIGDQFSVDPEISGLYTGGVHQYGFTVDEFTEIFEGLHEGLRKLLLFFAVLPPGSVINKRVLKNWWDGEGLVDLCIDKAEKMTNLMVKKLTERCLIEPVREKCALIGFKMHPLIRPMVVGRAEDDGFFIFDSQGNLTGQLTESNRVCLVTGNDLKRSRDEIANTSDLDLKRLQTLFNINESYPDFTLDLFLKLRNLRVLGLGRWQSSSDHHIELESTEFLEGLKYMKGLRYFSLRGVSRIFKLPDAVCKLSSLRILDLNACHNLEELPNAIGSLKKLISLDISECYLLDRMPESLAMLTELRILKGFLITSEGCSFTDLGELKKLIKLSVNVSRESFFPNTEDFHTFQKFELLEKLNISWGGKSVPTSTSTRNEVNKPLKKIISKLTTMKPQNDQEPEVPEGCFKSLKKLNLQCYPQEEVWWLKPHHFKKLKKLCIQGGKLKKLPETPSGDCWTKVESLHLKFLSDISLLDLKGYFPKVTYLEIFGCDNLGESDCDESWLNRRASLNIKNGAENKIISIWFK